MTRDKPILEILFGPIASGKSTYSSKRARDGALIANDDAITAAVHAGHYNLWHESFKPLYVNLTVSIVTAAASSGRGVVIDSTGQKRSTRDFYRTLGHRLGFKTALVSFRKGRFDGKLDGERRFNADPRGFSLEKWITIGECHASNVEQPTDEERALFDLNYDHYWIRGKNEKF